MSARPHMTCPACGKYVRITAVNELRKHTARPGVPCELGGRWVLALEKGERDGKAVRS